MSNRLFQTVLNQMKDVIGRTIGVIDDNGIIIACSELSKIGESKQRIREELTYSSGPVVYDGSTYRAVAATGQADSAVFVSGDDMHADKMSELLAISIGNIKSPIKSCFFPLF